MYSREVGLPKLFLETPDSSCIDIHSLITDAELSTVYMIRKAVNYYIFWMDDFPFIPGGISTPIEIRDVYA